MSEDLEKQKRVEAEDEARRNRDQELATILAMNEKGRKDLMKKCYEEEEKKRVRVSLGNIPLLAFDARDPENLAISAGFGQHYEAVREVSQGIDLEDWERQTNLLNQLVGRRIWRGLIISIPEFQSKIVKLYIQIDTPYLDDYLLDSEKQEGEDKKRKYFLKRLGGIWQFFKEKYPDWIMVDINGNPLEEVLKQEETAN